MALLLTSDLPYKQSRVTTGKSSLGVLEMSIIRPTSQSMHTRTSLPLSANGAEVPKLCILPAPHPRGFNCLSEASVLSDANIGASSNSRSQAPSHYSILPMICAPCSFCVLWLVLMGTGQTATIPEVCALREPLCSEKSFMSALARITGYEQPYGLAPQQENGPFPKRQNDRGNIFTMLYPEPLCECTDPCPQECADPATASAECARNPGCVCPDACTGVNPPSVCGASPDCPSVACPAECDFSAASAAPLAQYYAYCRRNPNCACPPKCSGCDSASPGEAGCASDCDSFAGCSTSPPAPECFPLQAVPPPSPAPPSPSLPPSCPPVPPPSPPPSLPPSPRRPCALAPTSCKLSTVDMILQRCVCRFLWSIGCTKPVDVTLHCV